MGRAGRLGSDHSAVDNNMGRWSVRRSVALSETTPRLPSLTTLAHVFWWAMWRLWVECEIRLPSWTTVWLTYFGGLCGDYGSSCETRPQSSSRIFVGEVAPMGWSVWPVTSLAVLGATVSHINVSQHGLTSTSSSWHFPPWWPLWKAFPCYLWKANKRCISHVGGIQDHFFDVHSV